MSDLDYPRMPTLSTVLLSIKGEARKANITLNENDIPKTFKDIILSYRPDCFELVGYESHSGIKAPLSN